MNPKIIVILAGINNIGTDPGGPEKASHITSGMKAIVDVCQAKAPGATIVLMAIFPRNDNPAMLPLINEVNRRIAALAKGKRIRFVDINRKLADENGAFFPGMVNADKLHPTVNAYQVWADALKPIFREILGRPAATDHAPPATGDPNASSK